jgi:hypothetical protein
MVAARGAECHRPPPQAVSGWVRSRRKHHEYTLRDFVSSMAIVTGRLVVYRERHSPSQGIRGCGVVVELALESHRCGPTGKAG